jgi:hypothetical protein
VKKAQGDVDPMEKAIRAYCALGWKLFPVRASKVPHRDFRWKVGASDDPDVVLAMMGQFPGSPLAGATGAASGFFVLDVDLGHGTGRDARESMRALLAQHGNDFQMTLTHSTPSGGKHYVYAIPPGTPSLPNTAGTLFGAGIDSRGDGGYVVLPPSAIDGGAYKVVSGDSIGPAPLPEWMVDLVLGRTSPASGVNQIFGPGKSRGPLTRADAEALVSAKVIQVAEAPRGSRNATLNSSAFVVGTVATGLGLTDDDLTERFTSAAGANGSLRDDGGSATLATIRSGLAAGRKEPAPMASEPTAATLAQGVELPDTLKARLDGNPALANEVASLQLRREAKSIDLEIEALKDPLPPVDMGTLGEMLARPDDTRWRVEGLLPAGGRAVVISPRKVGKSTLLGNLARALVTGEDFLGRFPIKPVEGAVMYLNYEMSGPQFGRWLGDMQIPAHLHDRIVLVNLRGRENLLATDRGRAELVQIMLAAKVEVLIVDPFGRAFTGDNQNDNTQVDNWLKVLDRVATDGGAKEVALVVHAGWGNGGDVRARGASALEDWPDSIIRYSREKDIDGAPRFLEAEGRDVSVDKDRVHYNPETRTLTMTGTGGPQSARRSAKASSLTEPVFAIVESMQGASASAIEMALRGVEDIAFQKGDDSAAIKQLVAEGRVIRFKQSRTTHHYTLGHVPKKFEGQTPLDGHQPLTIHPQQKGTK